MGERQHTQARSVWEALELCASSSLVYVRQQLADGRWHLSVTGPAVRLSDVAEVVRDLRGDCALLDVVALNTLLVDADLDLQGQRTVVTLATAHLLDDGEDHVLNLSGSPGVTWPGAAAAGQPGKPGRPGSSAGSLVIVAGSVNCPNLTVRASGGPGAAGQPGGAGNPGRDADNGDRLSGYLQGVGKPELAGNPYLPLMNAVTWVNVDTGLFDTSFGVEWPQKKHYLAWIRVDKLRDGTPGGHGGAGGAGGLGGASGHAVVCTPHQAAARLGRVTAEEGRPGQDGTAGAGGEGGKHQDDQRVYVNEDNFRVHFRVVKRCSRGRASSGQAGSAECVREGREAACPAVPLPAEWPFRAQRLYRLAALDRGQHDVVQDFLRNIEIGAFQQRTVDSALLELGELGPFIMHLVDTSLRRGKNYVPHICSVERHLAALWEWLPANPLLVAWMSVITNCSSILQGDRVLVQVADIKTYLASAVGKAEAHGARLKSAESMERTEAQLQGMSEAHAKVRQLLESKIEANIRYLEQMLPQAIANLQGDCTDHAASLAARRQRDEARLDRLEERLAFERTMATIVKMAAALPYVGPLVAKKLELGEAMVARVTKVCQGISTSVCKGDEVRRGGEDLVAALEEEMRRTEDSIQACSYLAPLIEKMKPILAEALGASSLLEVRELKMSKKLGDVRRCLARLGVPADVARVMEQYLKMLDDILTQQGEVFGWIEDASTSLAFADLIASVGPREGQEVAVVPLELRSAQDVGLLVCEYTTAMTGFQQWAFPFGNLIAGQMRVPRIIAEKGVSTVNLKDLVQAAVADFSDLLLKISQENSTYQLQVSRCSIVTSKLAECADRDEGTLLLWSGRRHSAVVAALLRGEAVLLDALPALLQDPSADGLMVAEVQLRLSSDDLCVQEELDAKMKRVRVVLSHSGIHHYRCGDSVYQVVTHPLEVVHSVGVGREPQTANDVYRKLCEHEPLLSPFTTWTARLHGADPSLGDMEVSADRVDIRLAARFSYVSGFPGPERFGDQPPAFRKVDTPVDNPNAPRLVLPFSQPRA